MAISPEIMNRYFEPLVGTPERVTELTQYLTAAVTDKDPAQEGLGPYDRLLEAGVSIASAAANTTQGISGIDWANLRGNGTVGITLTVNTLKTLGDLYIAHATGPQLITGVRRNASTALRHTYRVAFTDRDAGSINIRAMELGISPRNPIARAYYLVHGKFLNRRPTKNISPRAFRVKHEEGQLHIEPRHRHIPKLQEKQCPATYAKVATAEGQRPALLLFMETIGRVAVDEIYPQYFDITRDRLA